MVHVSQLSLPKGPYSSIILTFGTMFLNFANLRVHVPLGLQDSLRFGVQQLLVLDEPVVLLLG